MPHDDKEPKKPHPKPNGHPVQPATLDAPAPVEGSGGNSPPPQPPKKP